MARFVKVNFGTDKLNKGRVGQNTGREQTDKQTTNNNNKLRQKQIGKSIQAQQQQTERRSITI